MAKDREPNTKNDVKTNSTPYIIAAAVFGLVMLLNMFLVNTLFKKTTEISTRTSTVMNTVNQIMSQFNEANSKVLLLAAGIGERAPLMEDIALNCENVDDVEDEIDRLNNLPDLAIKRYNYAKTAVNAYFSVYNELKDKWADASYSEDMIANDYTQSLQALHVTAGQMISAITKDRKSVV